jgi:outer membrane biosynthesis protein TonB
MNSKLTIVLLIILSTGQQLRAANINQQSQSIVGGNSNSFNRNVGKSVVQNINNFGSLLFPDEPQPQLQEQEQQEQQQQQQQQQPVTNSEPLKLSQQQPVPDNQPQPNDPQQQQPNSQQQQVSNSPQLEPLPDSKSQVTNSPQPQQISVNSQPIQISLIPI